MEKKISVIIPVYNIESYIGRCLESIVNQSFKDIEIIVVNDASQDCSLDIIKEYQKQDTRIILIDKKKNEGLSAARNSGLEIAKGEYILHIDGDDWIEQGYFEAMYEKRKGKFGNVDVIISDYCRDDDHGNIRYINDYGHLNFERAKNTDFIRAICFGKGSSAVWNKLIKKELYDKYKIKFVNKISYGEDLIVVPKILYYAQKINKLERAYLHYMKNPKSITQYQNYKKVFEIYFVLEELEKFFKEEIFPLDILRLHHLTSCLFYNTYNFKDSDYVTIVKKYLKLIRKMNIMKIQNKKLEILTRILQWKIFNNIPSFLFFWHLYTFFYKKIDK